MEVHLLSDAGIHLVQHALMLSTQILVIWVNVGGAGDLGRGVLLDAFGCLHDQWQAIKPSHLHLLS